MTSCSAKAPTRPGEGRETLRILDERRGRGRVSGLQEVRDQHQQSFGGLLELGQHRLRQLQRSPVVSLLRLRAGESDAGRRIPWVELEDSPEDRNRQLFFSLERVGLGEVQLGPDEAGLEPDGLLEQLGALPKPVLTKADGAQHRAGRGSRLGIGKRELSLLVGFLEAPFLDQGGRSLEGLLRLRAEGDAGHRHIQEEDGKEEDGAKNQARAFAGSEAPSRETGRPPGRDQQRSLRSPLRHDYHYQ